MEIQYRFDTFEPLPWEKFSDGRYWGHVGIGKVGHKLPYRDYKGKERIEYASEEGLFNKDYVESLAGCPIVLHHPQSGFYKLNTDGLKVGQLTTRFAREDDELIFEAFIDDYRGVARIDQIIKKGGTPEVSPGYELKALIRQDDGTYEQHRLRNDHIAAPLYPGQGRGGSAIRMRFDSLGEINSYKDTHNQEIKNFMKTIEINKRRFDIDDEVLASEIGGLIARYDELNEDYSRILGEIEGVKLKLDELEKDQPTSDEINADVKDRIETWRLVLPYLRADDANYKPDFSASPEQIKALYLSKKYPNIKLDGRDGSFITGLWEGAKPEPQDLDALDIARTDALFGQISRASSQDNTQSGRNDVRNKEIMDKVRDRYNKAYKRKRSIMMEEK